MLRELAHLREQLGEERFQILINSDNTGKVRQFCDSLIRDCLSTEMVVGDRTYDILNFLQEDEEFISSNTMLDRAKGMGASCSQKDGEYILKHQDEIPADLRGKVSFIFPNWLHPADCPDYFSCIYWRGNQWIQFWYKSNKVYLKHFRFFRRK